jgi:hypothetical protein
VKYDWFMLIFCVVMAILAVTGPWPAGLIFAAVFTVLAFLWGAFIWTDRL